MSPLLTLKHIKRVLKDPNRLAALGSTSLLDTPPEEAFDRFTRLAVRLLNVTAAFVSLVDDKRVFFKSCSGAASPLADTRQVSIEKSLCPHAVAHGKLLLVSDARTDPQFQTLAAIRDFNLIAYAGMPLMTVDGHALGTFCIIDAAPRTWTQDEIDLFTDLGAAVVSEIELRISVSQRLQNAAWLEASEQRFNTAFQANPLPISIVSYPDGHILDVNQAVVRQLGYQREDMVGKTTAELQLYTDPQEREAFFRILREQGRVTDFEAQLKTKDGDVRFYLMSSEIIELDGRACLLTSTNDITARKRSELLLREGDRRKDELLGMLAHELRNPLAPIRNAVQVLKATGSTKAHLKTARDIVERQVTHMTRLIDDLVDVARVTQGTITLRKEKVELATVVGDAVDVAQPIITARGQSLKIELPHAPVPLYGDGVRLSQALSNILINAANYTQPGGTIELTGVKTSSEIAIHVRDNGAGIVPETLASVFEPFTQSERSLDRAQGGLGIGLALVKRLIEMHDGRVEAHSAGIGQGSEFILRLPVAPASVESIEPTEKIAASPGKKPRRILLVDDNEDSAEITAILLKLEGHDVTVAHDGPAAIKHVNTVRPDVLLLDIGLPGMDGYELARHLRELPETRDAVLIALTGYGRPEDRRNSQDAGYDHHLVKPIEPTELIALIAALD